MLFSLHMQANDDWWMLDLQPLATVNNPSHRCNNLFHLLITSPGNVIGVALCRPYSLSRRLWAVPCWRSRWWIKFRYRKTLSFAAS